MHVSSHNKGLQINYFGSHCSAELYYINVTPLLQSRGGHWIVFNLPNPSSRTVILGSTQPLPKMGTANFLGAGRSARLARKTKT
jgi:hypothetical protein